MVPDGKESLGSLSKFEKSTDSTNGSVYDRSQAKKRVDAGLRNLDHCKLSHNYHLTFDLS